MAGLEGYRPSKQNAKLHAKRNARQVEPKPTYRMIGEAEVVPGYQLAHHLQLWTVNFLRDRPRNSRRTGENSHQGGMTEFIGPVQLLAELTSIDVRRISGICNGEFVTVGISEADKILTAIDLEYLLASEIQVVQNPNWSLESWIRYMESRGCI